MSHVLENCHSWNIDQMERADDDAEFARFVPNHARKMVGKERVLLTIDEYRAQRLTDACRYSENAEALRAQLAA